MTLAKHDLIVPPSEEVSKKRTALGASPIQFAAILGLRANEASAEKIVHYEAGLKYPTESQIKKLSKLPFDPPFKQVPNNFKFRFIDLFAGIGGIRLPFHELGGHCVFTSEWDKDCQITYAVNFGEVPSGDITSVHSNDIPEHDLLLAGFPCQAFSQAGLKQGFFDTRGTMFFEIQRILARHRPSVFVLENVKQLVGHDKGQTLKTILGTLRGTLEQSLPDGIPMSEDARKSLSEKLNYAVDFRVLSSNNFGVPQKRERVFIIGLNRDKVRSVTDKDVTEIFENIQSKKYQPTRLGDILQDNATISDEFTISDRLWEGHQRRRKEHRERGNGFGYSLFNTESQYSNTISQRYYKDGSEALIDQSALGKNPRFLTPRECARLQGFPENYVIDAVSKVQNYRQFGNSVSVPVVRAIAEQLKQYFK